MKNRLHFSISLPDDGPVSWEPVPDGKQFDPTQTHTEIVDTWTVSNTKQLDTSYDYLEAAKYSAVAMQDFELAAAIRDLMDRRS